MENTLQTTSNFSTDERVEMAQSDCLLPITLWFRTIVVDGQLTEEFNHLEDGHVSENQERPTPKCPVHKAPWSRGQWRKELAGLTTGRPGRVVYSPAVSFDGTE